MPRTVRNFWLTLMIDGRRSIVRCGPTGRNGGFSLRIQVRENGDVSARDVVIEGNADDDRLTIVAKSPETYNSGAVLLKSQR